MKLIEARPEHLGSLKIELPAQALALGSGTEPAVLEAAGIRQAEIVAAVTGADEPTWWSPA